MNDILGVGKVVERLVEPVAEIIKKLAGPAAEEVGLSLQDSIKVWRAKRQYRLFEKIRQFVKEADYDPRQIPLKLLLPAVDYASVEDNEDLHTAWAALLSNAADPREVVHVHPSFPMILRDLSPKDAVFLNTLYASSRVSRSTVAIAQSITDIGRSRDDLMKVFVSAGLSRHGKMTSISVKEYNDHKDQIDKDEADFDITLEIALKHGVLLAHTRSELQEKTVYCDAGVNTSIYYTLSNTGYNFLVACQAPPKTGE